MPTVATNPLREKLGVKSPDEAIPYLNFLVYGDPGVGKTHLAGTALDDERTAPVLLLDVEGGAVTLRKRKNLDVIQIRSIADIKKINDEIFSASDPYWKTVIIDSLTELQKLDMRTVQEAEKRRTPDKVDIEVPSQRAWGKSGERMRTIITAYRDLPVHIIATCLCAQEFDEVNGTTNFYPSLPGKLRGDVPGYFDVVGLLKAEEKRSGNEVNIVRTLQTTKTRRVIAKDRTGVLDGVIENPTIPDMWEKIHA